MSAQNQDDLKTQIEFDRLMTAAHVNRRRGDYGQAIDLIRQALDLRPSDLEAREFEADLIYARGELQRAADAYKSLLDEDSSRVSVEEKFAKVTLEIAEGKRQRELLQAMLENPTRFRLPPRSPALAAILSGIPGLGHVYCGQYIKGAVLCASALLSWLLFFALRPEVSIFPAEDRISMFAKQLTPGAVIFLCAAVAVQVYAIVDAAVIAEKTADDKS